MTHYGDTASSTLTLARLYRSQVEAVHLRWSPSLVISDHSSVRNHFNVTPSKGH